nr:uncharacterized protein LOC117848200 [Setaria viridis]
MDVLTTPSFIHTAVVTKCEAAYRVAGPLVSGRDLIEEYVAARVWPLSAEFAKPFKLVEKKVSWSEKPVQYPCFESGIERDADTDSFVQTVEDMAYEILDTGVVSIGFLIFLILWFRLVLKLGKRRRRGAGLEQRKKVKFDFAPAAKLNVESQVAAKAKAKTLNLEAQKRKEVTAGASSVVLSSGSTASSVDLSKPAYVVPVSVRRPKEVPALAPSSTGPATWTKKGANKPRFARITVPGAKVDAPSAAGIKITAPSTSSKAKGARPLLIEAGKHERRVAAEKAKLVDAFSSDPKGACAEAVRSGKHVEVFLPKLWFFDCGKASAGFLKDLEATMGGVGEVSCEDHVRLKVKCYDVGESLPAGLQGLNEGLGLSGRTEVLVTCAEDIGGSKREEQVGTATSGEVEGKRGAVGLSGGKTVVTSKGEAREVVPVAVEARKYEDFQQAVKSMSSEELFNLEANLVKKVSYFSMITRDRLAKSEKAASELSKKVASLEATIAAMSLEMKKVKVENAELKEDSRRLGENYEARGDEIDRLVADIAELEGQMKEKDQIIGGLREGAQRDSKVIAGLKSKVSQMEPELETKAKLLS